MLYCTNSRYKCFVALGSLNDYLIWTPLQGKPRTPIPPKDPHLFPDYGGKIEFQANQYVL